LVFFSVHKRVVITSNKKSLPTENQKNRTPEQKQFTSSESHVSASLSTDTDVVSHQKHVFFPPLQNFV
jgi:hypothetical protein